MLCRNKAWTSYGASLPETHPQVVCHPGSRLRIRRCGFLEDMCHERKGYLCGIESPHHFQLATLSLLPLWVRISAFGHSLFQGHASLLAALLPDMTMDS